MAAPCAVGPGGRPRPRRRRVGSAGLFWVNMFTNIRPTDRRGKPAGMKIVLPGGSGHLGRLLTAAFLARGDEVVVLSRGASGPARTVFWDGSTPGPWTAEIDGADAVINLAGRSVNCRYTGDNLLAMLASRVDSTRAVGGAIAGAARPPRVWLQASTATIYAHSFEAANDDVTGLVGGHEPGVPGYWKY